MKKMSINKENDILNKLYDVVLNRKENPGCDSYVSSLLQKGKKRIHSKISEEADELIDASQKASRDDIIYEMADLWFHTVVLLGHWNIPPSEIYRELAHRWGRSGLEEKANRSVHK